MINHSSIPFGKHNVEVIVCYAFPICDPHYPRCLLGAPLCVRDMQHFCTIVTVRIKRSRPSVWSIHSFVLSLYFASLSLWLFVFHCYVNLAE